MSQVKIPENNVLHVENVTMQFGGVVAVNNLSMDVNRGEIVALIGPNGAGKTTAFNAITGVYEVTNGAIYFDGKLLCENYPQGKMKKTYAGENIGMYTHHVYKTPDKITKLGMARTFQNIRLFKTMTVEENILTAMHVRRTSNVFTATFRLNMAEEKKMREETALLIELVGLTDVKDELATNPSLLLLDEPAAGMNPQETDELTDFIRDIRKKFGLTILLIEHHMNLVMEISDRIYVIDFGRKIAEGIPSVIQSDKKVIDAYLGVVDDE